VNKAVLNRFCEVSQNNYGNPNASHYIGKLAKDLIIESTETIKRLLNCPHMEVIYTSGASEANNLAIKGIAGVSRHKGKHIISTCLEHASISGTLKWLQSSGYEIELVPIGADGSLDLDELKELLRADTILVSVGYVDSEVGVRQPIDAIASILSDYPNCAFHVDATQAIGKIPVDFAGVDLITFSPHKFFGLNGTGVLLRKESVLLEPIIHGGASTSHYRSGTPFTAGAAATAFALELCLENSVEKYKTVHHLNEMLQRGLLKHPLVCINSTGRSVPHILNISVKGVKASLFQASLDDNQVCISIKSACSTDTTPSRSVFSITGNRELARTSWRISLCHLTTELEITEFLNIFEQCYLKLTKK
jgi:cysteine desulfurase